MDARTDTGHHATGTATLKRILLIVVALATLAPSGARADRPTSFRSSGRCTEIAFIVPVEVERLSAYVPESFPILGAGGRTLLGVFAESCETSIDGRRASASVVSGLFAFTDDTRSPGGCQTYDFRWTNSRNDDFYRAMNGLGWILGLPDSTFSESAPTPVTPRIDVEVPDPEAPWRSRAVSPEAVGHDPEPFMSVHCFLGYRGLVRGTYTHDLRVAAGVVGVSVGDGAVWRQLHVASQQTAAALFRFSWTGITEIIPSAL